MLPALKLIRSGVHWRPLTLSNDGASGQTVSKALSERIKRDSQADAKMTSELLQAVKLSIYKYNNS